MTITATNTSKNSLCNKEFFNQVGRKLFLSSSSKKISSHIIGHRSSFVKFYFAYVIKQDILEANESEKHLIEKFVNTKIQDEFLHYLFGEFLCNTIIMASSLCYPVISSTSIERELESVVNNYYSIPANIRREPLDTTFNGFLLQNPFNIPQTIHYIWATSSLSPKQISSKNWSAIQAGIRSNYDMNFILWVNNRDILAPTIIQARQLGINIQSFDELTGWNKISYNVEDAIDKFQYGVVSDVLRYSILIEKGGIYLDLDYILINEINPLLKYDCFVMDTSLGTSSSFLGSKIGHPILVTALEISLNSLLKVNELLPHQKECYGRCNVGFYLAGPAAFKIAYYHSANQDTNDVEIPSIISENYECKQYVKCIDDNTQDVLQSLLDDEYCVGYSYGHHEGSGASWCLGY